MGKNNADIRLEEYKDFEQKNAYYQCNEVIDDEASFNDKFAEWKNQSADYVFRGVREAKYMMYTSAQRKWIQEKMFCNFNNYSFYISHLIEEAKLLPMWLYFVKKGIPINDFLILSLLQHYGAPSPLLDFSHNPRIALYFAFDKNEIGGMEEHEGIDKYVSLYRLKYKGNPYICSIQDVEEQATYDIDVLISDVNKNKEFCLEILEKHKEIKKFISPSYMEFKNVSPMYVIGGERGKTDIMSIALNFVVTYLFTNPRMTRQEASFILNTSGCRPLEEELMFWSKFTQPDIIECLNINKNLAKYVQAEYLKDIKEDWIYPEGDCKLIKTIKETV